MAISSKTEDFPTPVSPTRRLVYGAFTLFFDTLTIPFLRHAVSLENDVVAYLRVELFFSSSSKVRFS